MARNVSSNDLREYPLMRKGDARDIHGPKMRKTSWRTDRARQGAIRIRRLGISLQPIMAAQRTGRCIAQQIPAGMKLAKRKHPLAVGLCSTTPAPTPEVVKQPSLSAIAWSPASNLHVCEKFGVRKGGCAELRRTD